MSNFLDVQKVEKEESLIDIQMHRVLKPLLHRLPCLYRLQNLAVETSDLEPELFNPLV